MRRIVNGKVYDTKTADLVAHDHYWDGNNWDRGGRNTYLYKTKKGNFFLHRTTCWQGELDTIEPVTVEEAKTWYEQLEMQEMDYKEAFGVEPEEA